MAVRITTALIAALLIGGCSSYRAVDQPLETWDPSQGYQTPFARQADAAGKVFLVLAFSGGGTRASALSYGVLRELRDTPIPNDPDARSLLQEVDSITSVSGGSFTSAYYGLFGDRIFEDFEQRFLKKDVTVQLLVRLIQPWHWPRLLTGFFNRTELAVELYDQEIFDGATFADLEAAGGPFLQINATDLAVGDPFTFVQPEFDFMCIDLSQMKVARAVTASSSVPGIFAAITLRNYAGTCGFETPTWVAEGLEHRRTDPRRFRNAKIAASYLDAEKRKYIHLVDGGIADNIGLRRPLDNVIDNGGIWKRLDEIGAGRPDHLVVIVVNASTEPDTGLNLTPASPSLGTVLGSVTDVQLHRYNFETIDLTRRKMKEWARTSPPNADGEHLRVHMIEVAFDLLDDPQERDFFNNIETSFNLDDETVDRLIEVGGRLLRESPDYQQLLDSL